ncbi:hypothetical protein CHARACLAT_025234 [Characodon lateralis]|uniref:Uncharacterized protein n=1 Tax=Characodon lateralis TaxID=208331 RepID=A0ABU7CR67_9TELE|nr:hypothetical protein [Characodon lateralis]
MDGAKSRTILEENLVETDTDWGGGSPSSRTATLNIQPEQLWNGLSTHIHLLEWPSQSPDLALVAVKDGATKYCLRGWIPTHTFHVLFETFQRFEQSSTQSWTLCWSVT